MGSSVNLRYWLSGFSLTTCVEQTHWFRQESAGGARVNGNLNLSRAIGDLEYKKNFSCMTGPGPGVGWTWTCACVRHVSKILKEGASWRQLSSSCRRLRVDGRSTQEAFLRWSVTCVEQVSCMSNFSLIAMCIPTINVTDIRHQTIILHSCVPCSNGF